MFVNRYRRNSRTTGHGSSDWDSTTFVMLTTIGVRDLVENKGVTQETWNSAIDPIPERRHLRLKI